MNIKSIITAAVALLASTACSGGAKQEKVMKTEGKSIVVFFSHAGDNYAVGNIEVGNTKIVADYISEIIGADQFELIRFLWRITLAYHIMESIICPEFCTIHVAATRNTPGQIPWLQVKS